MFTRTVPGDMNAWPMIRRCWRAQWRGLDPASQQACARAWATGAIPPTFVVDRSWPLWTLEVTDEARRIHHVVRAMTIKEDGEGL